MSLGEYPNQKEAAAAFDFGCGLLVAEGYTVRLPPNGLSLPHDAIQEKVHRLVSGWKERLCEAVPPKP